MPSKNIDNRVFSWYTSSKTKNRTHTALTRRVTGRYDGQRVDDW